MLTVVLGPSAVTECAVQMNSQLPGGLRGQTMNLERWQQPGSGRRGGGGTDRNWPGNGVWTVRGWEGSKRNQKLWFTTIVSCVINGSEATA